MKNIYLKLKDRLWGNYLFLYSVLILYLIISIFNYEYIKVCIISFLQLFIFQIIPLLFIVYIFIFIFNLIIKNETLAEKISNTSSVVKYIFVILLWIISTWPVYMWYPILKKLHKHWLKYEHIATFIYSRAIKIPFLTIMFFYFWIKYTLLFNLTILVLAILIWVTINLLSNFIQYENNNS